MAINVSTAVWQLELPAGEKLVALALADHAHADGTEARPSLALLETKTGFDRSTIIRHLKALRQKEIIMVQRKATSTLPTVYRFVISIVKASYPQGSQNAT